MTNSSLSIISECRAGIIWGTEDFIIQALACFLPSRLPTVLMRSPKPPLDPSPLAAPTPPDHRQQQFQNNFRELLNIIIIYFIWGLGSDWPGVFGLGLLYSFSMR